MRRIALSAFALLAAGSAHAQAVHQYGGLVLSAKGDLVASIEQAAPAPPPPPPAAAPGATAAPPHAAIVVRAAGDGRIVRRIDPCPSCSYSGLTYGPDGSLAFLARDRAAATLTLMVDGGKAARRVAVIGGIAQSPRFSPDGKRIALLVTLGAAKEAGATQAGVRQIGEIGETSDEQRLAVFDVARSLAAAEVKPVSPADRYIYEYDWTPDGTGFVVTSALGNGDDNWWVATLDAVDATTGAVRPIAAPRTQLNFPRVSPDGKTVAYIGGLMSDFGSIGGDLWTVPLAGGTPSNRTLGYKATVTSIQWTRAGLLGTILSGADASLVRFDQNAGGAVLWSKPAGLSAGAGRVAFSADGRSAASVVQDYEHAPAIYAGPVTALVPIVHDNDAIAPVVAARSVTWRNEGFDAQGWLLAPIGADPKVNHPMVTAVHGGPSAAVTPGFISPGSTNAALVKAGYYVFLPNPRGSYGQGEAFTAANKRDFGGGDLRDVLAGIDAVERVAPIDETRLGLMGCSYGGFMAMWANTQTDRFKAIVAGAGISNWISYYGTNGIDQWMLPFFGKSMYDDRKVYEDASAIYRIDKAKTPTFIYVGERDIEVPPTQSIEHWHALKARGVPVSLVIYPDAGHCVTAPAQATDVRARTVAWFGKYLK